MITMITMIVMRLAGGLENMAARSQLIDTGPLKRILRLQKVGVRGQRTRQIKRTQPQHRIHRHVGVLRTMNTRCAVDGADGALDAGQIRLLHQIRFVEDDHIGKAHLHGRLLQLAQMLLKVPRIDHRDDRIKRELCLEVLIQEEGLRDRPRIRHTSGLDEHMIKPLATLEQLPQHTNQITAHRAADATIAGLKDFLFSADHQLVIHAHFAELVFDDRDTPAMVLGQDAVEQRGLARA